MRNRMSDLQAGRRRVLVLGVVVLLAGVLGGCVGGPTWPGFQSPPATPTSPSSPLASPTPPPKPTDTPAPTPTHTPVPTPLPLPSSTYYALWVDTVPHGAPGSSGSNGTIWLADPNDVANRRQVMRLNDQEIQQAAVSPDGRQIAFIAWAWRAQQSPLWLVNMDGTGLRQLLPDANQAMWSRDGHTLAYTAGESPQGLTLETVDVATGESRRLASIEPQFSRPLVGWSANDQEVYYLHQLPLQEGGLIYELWAADRNGQVAPHKVATLEGEVGYPRLSPDGTRLLYFDFGSPGVRLLDLAQGTTRRVQSPGKWVVTWGLDGTELISFIAPERDTLVLRRLDVATDHSQDIALFQNEPIGVGWDPLGLSPDRQWVAAIHHYTGMHWLHLPSGMDVLVPNQGRLIFVGWVPRPTG